MEVRKFLTTLSLTAMLGLLHAPGLRAANETVSLGDTILGAERVAFSANDSRVQIKRKVGGQKDLNAFAAMMDKLLANENVRLKTIVVTGFASPDGPLTKNWALAQKRADNLKASLMRSYSIPQTVDIDVTSVAEDWDGLERYVAAASLKQLPHRDAILELIQGDLLPDAKEKALSTRYPADYRYLRKHCLPQLRRSEYIIEYDTDSPTDTYLAMDEEPIVETPNSSNDDQYEAILDSSNNEMNDYTANLSESKQEETAAQPTVESTATTADEVVEVLPPDSLKGAGSVGFLINDSRLRVNVNNNEQDLNLISATLTQLMGDTTMTMKRITICGYASPDGPYAFNERLARKRTETLKSLVVSKFHIPADQIETVSVAEDWEGLESCIAASTVTALPHRDQLLEVIHSNRTLDEKERIFRRRYPADFKYLKTHCLPQLRRTEFLIDYQKDNFIHKVKEVVGEPPQTISVEPYTVEEPVEPAAKKSFFLAARTNLLYDAVVIPNVGVEVYLGKQLTLGADWFYTWFKSDTHHRYWQGYGGYLTLRKYFGEEEGVNPFKGHHLGIYGTMLTYDVEWGGRGYQSPTKWGWGGGVEYGYSMPIGRRLDLDFNLGIGYQGGKYYEYLPMDGHYVWQSTHHRNWFGPTKAEVSLKWLLGRGNVNVKKGVEL